MSKDQRGRTGGRRDVEETELRDRTVAELRERAKSEGVGSTSRMRKDELVEAITQAHRAGSSKQRTDDAGSARKERAEDKESAEDAGPAGGRARTGSASSSSVAHSQEITSPDETPERPGRSLVTTSHDVIRQWAEARGGRPATVLGTEHEGRAGVLRFDFGEPSERLREVSWDEWFETFDARGLNFIYQEERKDGRQSNFFRLENPTREDA